MNRFCKLEEDKEILTEEEARSFCKGREGNVAVLKEKGLLPLRLSSEKLPILAKLIGFFQGDAWLGYNYDKRRNKCYARVSVREWINFTNMDKTLQNRFVYLMNYVYDYLSKQKEFKNIKLQKISGSGSFTPKDRQKIIERFKNKEIDILLSTDVLSEGQNSTTSNPTIFFLLKAYLKREITRY